MFQEIASSALRAPDVQGLADVVDSALMPTHAQRRQFRNQDCLDAKDPHEHIETCLSDMCNRAYAYARELEKAGKQFKVYLFDHPASPAFSIALAEPGLFGTRFLSRNIVTLTGYANSDEYDVKVNTNALVSNPF